MILVYTVYSLTKLTVPNLYFTTFVSINVYVIKIMYYPNVV